VLPAIRKMAAEKSQDGNELVVISNCVTKEEMCTHYVPLSQGKAFLAGRPTMEEHMQTFADSGSWFVDWKQIKGGARKVYSFFEKQVGGSPRVRDSEQTE
jgi:hypothetical protein